MANGLKRRIVTEQDGLDAITQAPLATEMPLIDKDRIIAKAEGGRYEPRTNVRALDPLTHMRRHGTLRTREEALDSLKSLFDDRVQMMKLLLKENNQMLAYERRVDHTHPETLAFLKEHLKPIEARLAQIDKAIAQTLKTYPDPLVHSALGVPGVGPVTVAALTAYIDFQKMVCNRCHHLPKPADADAPEHDEQGKTVYCKCEGTITLVHAASTPSALWKYVGLHCPSHERYTAGEASGGNKTLRTVLYNTACTMVKLGEGPYRQVYDRTKLRLSQSETIVKSRNTQGRLVELPWREVKPSHRHGAALRAVIKHLLADYWYTGRTFAGLPTLPLYAESMLEHTHMVAAVDRGWKVDATKLAPKQKRVKK